MDQWKMQVNAWSLTSVWNVRGLPSVDFPVGYSQMWRAS
jgi:hypothetical protein